MAPAFGESAYARSGPSMFLRVFSPRSAKEAGNFPAIASRTAADTTIPPGCAMPSSRAATLTAVPNRSPALSTTSPRWMPMRTWRVCSALSVRRAPAGEPSRNSQPLRRFRTQPGRCRPAVLAIRPRCCLMWFCSGLPDGSEGSESPCLIRLHELRIANDIRRHNGGEATVWFGLMVHSDAKGGWGVRGHPTGR